jgi:23S rRNA (uridine2552-2'-O)-methyltransferase
LLECLKGQAVDLVLSDMAPNISGIASADQAGAIYLAELALDFAGQTLKRGGSLLIKTFQGAGFPELRKRMMERFEHVLSRKPRASRAESREIYLLGKGLRLYASGERRTMHLRSVLIKCRDGDAFC